VAWGFALSTAAIYDRVANRGARRPSARQAPPTRPLPSSPAP
jgi:hypothetical protein